MSDIDSSGLRGAVTALADDLIQRLGDEFVARAQARCSRRTGALADSITVLGVTSSEGQSSCTVTVTEDYGRYQDEGTGEFGPEGGRIYPVSAKVLAFDWPAAGGVVFAASVAGAPGTHFFSDTVDEWPDIVGSVA